jgi:hypothetical protein
MAEENEHPSGTGEEPPQQTERLESHPAPRPSRWRRWSSNGSVRAGGLTLVAGLVGGLVGGGVVALADHGHDDRTGPVRISRGADGPGFRGPGRWYPPYGGYAPNRRIPLPNRPDLPNQPPTPAPTPTPSG